MLDHVEDFIQERGVGSGVIGVVGVDTGELVEFLQRVFPASRVAFT